MLNKGMYQILNVDDTDHLGFKVVVLNDKTYLIIFDSFFNILQGNNLFNTIFKDEEARDELSNLVKLKNKFSRCIEFDFEFDFVDSCKSFNAHLYFVKKNKKHYLFLVENKITISKFDLEFKLKYYDLLTDLPNRHLFYLLFERIIKKRNTSQHGVISINLDGFRVVNNYFGHRAGDNLILQISKNLSAYISNSGWLFRMAGDSFLILQENIEGIKKLEILSENLIDLICTVYPIEKMEMLVTASIGISHYPSHGYDVDTLLKKADIALYDSKSTGYNNYKIFNPEMIKSTNAYLTLGGDLRNAIENENFELYYQPKVNAESFNIMGAEVLIRWQHPEMGLITPDRFIPIAEESGLIIPLGEWIIRDTCSQLLEWDKNNEFNLIVSINISMKQLAHNDFIDMVVEILSEYKINPKRLEFEITETVLMNDVNRIIDKINKLKDIGINISIDDFGTGYSSLSYLKILPIEIIKIDKSFIRELCCSDDDKAIVEATINMALSLNIEVVAEGVENMEQIRILRNYGCHYFQGYYFSKPIRKKHLSVFVINIKK